MRIMKRIIEVGEVKRRVPDKLNTIFSKGGRDNTIFSKGGRN
jgi:hypothetical protein